MAVFGYRVTDPGGRVSEGVIEAAGEPAAVGRLREMGYVPIRVWPASGPAEVVAGARRRGPREPSARKDVLPFLQGLKTLLSAGVPLDRALVMLGDLFREKAMGRVAAALLEDVRAGMSLSDAMRKAPGTPFNRFTVQMVAAGQAAGRLEDALGQVHAFLERSRDFRSSLMGSLIYPAILVTASVLSIVLMVVYVVPKVAGIFAAARATLPLPTRMLLAASGFLQSYGLYILAALVLGGMLFSSALRRPGFRRDFDRAMLGWPLAGGILTAIETSRVTRSLSSLLAGGVPILSAFMIAREVSGNLAVREGIEAARVRVQAGAKLARALSETTPFPDLALQMIAVGEETGGLEGMLASVADTYEENARRALRTFLVLLEPVVILGMGLVVGFIVFSLFLAVFRLNEVAF